MTKNNNLVVCFDLDDVLTGFMKGFVDHHNGSSKGAILDYDDVKTLNIKKLLGITQDEAWVVVESYYKSKAFDSLIPFDGVIKVINDFRSNGFKIVVVTYRSGTGFKKSVDWLEKHFGGDVKLIHGLDKSGERMNKGRVCQAEGVSFILEDCLDNAIHCYDVGIKAFLLTMPWNIDRPVPRGVVRVSNHKEFFDRVMELSKK